VVDARDICLVIPDGHRYFRYQDLIAVADQSGRTPEETDDGMLYLDRSRPVVFGQHGCHVPLITPDGTPTRTPCSAYEAWQVVHVLEMNGQADPSW
jgi:hypothetical protein